MVFQYFPTVENFFTHTMYLYVMSVVDDICKLDEVLP